MFEPNNASFSTLQVNRNRRALAGIWLLVGMVVMLAVIAALQPLP